MQQHCSATSVTGQHAGRAPRCRSEFLKLPVIAAPILCWNLQVHEALSSFGSLHLEGRISSAGLEDSLIWQISRPRNAAQVEGLPSARLHSPNDVFCEAHMPLSIWYHNVAHFQIKLLAYTGYVLVSGDIWLQCGDEDTSPNLDLLIWCEVFSFTWQCRFITGLDTLVFSKSSTQKWLIQDAAKQQGAQSMFNPKKKKE